MTTTPDTERALRAAVRIAARHGVSCAGSRVISAGANVLVHLAPAPVVARVATLTRLVRPAIHDSFAREIAIAAYLHDAGVPVVPPAGDLHPGPHGDDGYAVSFWRYIPPVPEAAPLQPSTYGRMLRELHEALRGYEGPIGPLGTGGPPLGDIPAFLDRAGGTTPVAGSAVTLTRAEIGALREELARLLPVPVDGSEQALHGDAHPGNLLAGAAGWVWGDFEEACRGSTGWDLASAARTRRLDGAAALAAYGDVPDLSRFTALRDLHGLVWWLMLAGADPRHAPIAADRLGAWRARRARR